jgi:hypothetical protein
MLSAVVCFSLFFWKEVIVMDFANKRSDINKNVVHNNIKLIPIFHTNTNELI